MTAVRTPRVLVVEDEAAIADSLIYVLRNDGFSADHVLSGDDALSAQRQLSYDLILLDVGLPDITGLEVLRRLRSEGVNVPVEGAPGTSESDETNSPTISTRSAADESPQASLKAPG